MKSVEIITLRFSGPFPSPLANQFLEELGKVNATKDLEEIRIYRNASNDVSIHIHWTSTEEGQRKSAFGLMLFQALKDYGLLSHSMWVETAAIAYPPAPSQTSRLQGAPNPGDKRGRVDSGPGAPDKERF